MLESLPTSSTRRSSAFLASRAWTRSLINLSAGLAAALAAGRAGALRAGLVVFRVALAFINSAIQLFAFDIGDNFLRTEVMQRAPGLHPRAQLAGTDLDQVAVAPVQAQAVDFDVGLDGMFRPFQEDELRQRDQFPNFLPPVQQRKLVAAHDPEQLVAGELRAEMPHRVD